MLVQKQQCSLLAFLLSGRNSGSLMGYKSQGVLHEVVVIKREVKALALNCARGKRGDV